MAADAGSDLKVTPSPLTLTYKPCRIGRAFGANARFEPGGPSSVAFQNPGTPLG